jgi:ankyrin repeat protein
VTIYVDSTRLFIGGLFLAHLSLADGTYGLAGRHDRTGSLRQDSFRRDPVQSATLPSLNMNVAAQRDDAAKRLTTAESPQLLRAAERGDLVTVRALVGKGVNVNTKDDDGVTALMAASFAGRLPVLRFLLDRGADVNAVDGTGSSALWYGAAANTETVTLLLDKGADPNARGRAGFTPLIVASRSNVAMVRALLAHGADVNGKNRGEQTALMEAARNGQVEIVRFLIDTGADVNAVDYLGYTAIKNAQRTVDEPAFGDSFTKPYRDIVALLRSAGAK